MARMVLARIKRFGNQWASCGVPVRPPEDMVGRQSTKRLCPKLVPGQVIKIPEDHNLLNQECVEIVRKVAHDEFIRPWVFANAEQATMANPTKSRLGATQIAMGLNMAIGAAENRRKALADREAAQEELERAERNLEAQQRRAARTAIPEDDDVLDGPGDDVDQEDEDDGYVPNPRNRLTKDEADELRGRTEDAGDDEAEAVTEHQPRRGKGRGVAAERAPRVPRRSRGE